MLIHHATKELCPTASDRFDTLQRARTASGRTGNLGVALRGAGHGTSVRSVAQRRITMERSGMAKPAKNTICLWYDGGAEEAARFYAETFPDSSVGAVHRAPGDNPSG